LNDLQFGRHARHLLIAWIALIALMLASFGSAYLKLGPGNAVASIGIGVLKAAIIVAVFMGIAHGATTIRIVAATAFGTWLIMLGLGSVDVDTRARAPAAMQPPHQFEPGHMRGAR
jgi:cytochrome c oxidase subunit IV